VEARHVLRIARGEVLKGTETVDRRTVLGFLAAVAVTAALGSALSAATVTHDAGIYRVGVAEDSAYYGPASADPTFTVVEPRPGLLADGEAELTVRDGRVYPARSRKGRAALAAFRTTVRDYNDATMADESNLSAAFPVAVELEYVQRDAAGPEGTDDEGTTGDDGGSNETDGGGAPSIDTGAGGQAAAPSIGGQPILAGEQSGSPSTIQPPFPLGSLLLAFLFVVPMNFVIQAYGASIMRERINRRGELLLVAPLSPVDIVFGKTLPYLLAISVAAVAPIATLFLSATFVAAMFARSFKELTFLTVTISVTLTSYAFVPAVFTEVTPIALISPLTIVVRDLLGQSPSIVEYVFSTGPLYLSSGVLFLLGTGIYREEDLFSQRPVHLKAVDALASRVRGPASVGLLTVAFIPFVVLAELLAVALLFVFPTELSIPALLFAAAVVEEASKSAHVYAGYHHELFERRVPVAIGVGATGGLGFFLAEKLTLIVRLVNLPGIIEGRIVFPEAAAIGATQFALLLVAPLAMHCTTAAISAVGASRGARGYAAGFCTAVLVHLSYNLGVFLLVA
jgi:ABC-type Na+ efflux pump permease subunit